jgi:hypothetical protein
MNYLLNVGPLPDGSVHPANAETLREVGRRIRQNGWPKGVTKLPRAMQQSLSIAERTPPARRSWS